MPADAIFTKDFKTTPYWWEAAPPEDSSSESIPITVDVVIVGSGFCGLVAASDLSRSGLSVVVFDAGPLGYGASTRSGGMTSSGQKLVLTGAYKSLGKGNADGNFCWAEGHRKGDGRVYEGGGQGIGEADEVLR